MQDETVQKLEELAGLLERKIITREEYEVFKKRLLAAPPPADMASGSAPTVQTRSDEFPTPSYPSPSTKKPSKNLTKILLAAIALVFAGTAIFFFVGKSKLDEAQTKEEVVEVKEDTSQVPQENAAGSSPSKTEIAVANEDKTDTGKAQEGETQSANQGLERDLYTPEETVRLFYDWISKRHYAKVYDEVFSEYRKSRITKEGFIGGFRNTISVTRLEVRTTQEDDSSARVAVKIKSLDRSETGGPEIEKVFQGEWVLVKEDGLWLLDSSNIRQVSGGKASKQVLVLPDGSKYEGEVVNGMPHGKGTRTWPNGGRDVGDFVDGELHGKGTSTWPGGYYKGDWVEGHMTGKGIYDYEGEHYEGDFDHDRLSGKGIMTWADGTSYEGDWEGGQRTGYGVLKDKNGKVLKKGRFENDEYVGP